MSCFEFLLKLRSIFKNEPQVKYELALLYKRRFQNTIFYQVCTSSLRYITRQSSQFSQSDYLSEQSIEHQSTRKSTSSISHYENANINFSQQYFVDEKSNKLSNPEHQYQSIPKSFQYMSINEKQQLLKDLIEKSYLFVDLSDLFSGEDLQVYENIVKQEIFTGEESIMDSILQTTTRKGVQNKLKYFDSQAFRLLKIYVNFCTQMIEKLQPISLENESSYKTFFLPRLILHLRARLQIEFPDAKVAGKVSQLNKLVEEYQIMNDIILCTLQKTQKIRIIPEISHQYAQNFFTYQNISTLISVILFMDENFLKAIFDRFMEGLKICIGRIGEKLNILEKKFIDELKGSYFGFKPQITVQSKKLSTRDLFSFKSNYQKIMEGGSQIKFPYFKKSLRTLQTLTSQKEPIKTLKIIYELNKTIQKQHTEFINSMLLQEMESVTNDEGSRVSYEEMRKSQKTKKYSFSRETEQKIIEFLLSKKKDKLRFIVTNIMITHFFVHPNQLKDKKGSCLAPFVQIIKSLGLD